MVKKDDLPAMMFYVGDWLKAPDIQCLSYELKGIWFEMLCYMWESQERGYLNYNTEELARLLRLPEDLLKQKLEQLLKRAIYSVRESDGVIYCRRMVKDQEIREIRKKAGSLGGKQSFANRFAQAKKQANTEDEIEDEIEIDNKNINVLWIRTFGRNPKIPEAEETEKLIEKFGYDKVYQIFKQATLDGFHKIKTLVDALDDQGNIKQKKIIDKYAKPNAVNLHPMNKTTCDACTKVAVLWSDGFAGCSYEHIIEAKQKRKKLS